MSRTVQGLMAALIVSAGLKAGGAVRSEAPTFRSALQEPRQTFTRISTPADHNPVEVSLAINPTNPDNVVAVSYQQGLPSGPRTSDFIYTSFDGGRTWSGQPAPNLDARTQGDDAVTFDPAGTVLHSHIAFAGIREARPTRATTGIFVSRSEDGGRSWHPPLGVIDHFNSVMPFEDKPWLAATRTAGGESHVYVAWTRFDEYGSQSPDCHSHIMFARSVDGGRTFAPAFRISDVPGDCRDSDNTDEGAVPSVGVNGEVFIAWGGPAGLVFDRSLDGGQTFGVDRKIADMPGGWDFGVNGVDRANGMPVTGVDRSNGPQRGSIYVNWIDARNGDPDVFLSSSRDGGRTWSAPVRVNDDPVSNGAVQFFTWMSIDPTDGSVNVIFFDRRNQTGTATGVTVARSTDGGRTFVNYPLNVPAFRTSASLAFGDYIGIAAYGRRAIGAFPYFLDDHTIALGSVRLDF